jgi:putative sterol carrier protein
MSVTIAELMSKLPGAFEPEKAAGMDAVVHFKLTGAEAGEWNAVIKNGRCEVAQGLPHSRPTVTVSADSADLIQIFNGELDGVQAFMGGRIKVTGDMTAAMKIIEMFKA